VMLEKTPHEKESLKITVKAFGLGEQDNSSWELGRSAA
jgi:hypothetical protein